jgi:hypothetical protein
MSGTPRTRRGTGGCVSCSRNSVSARLLVGLLLSSACGREHAADPVQLRLGARGEERVLSVVPASGYRINGRVPPALELATGEVVRLAGGRVSPDSAYFLEAPWALAPAAGPLRGTLRASVCRADESLCRIALVPVDLHD